MWLSSSLSAPAFFRIDPHAQTYGIESDLLHQSSSFPFFSGRIVESLPVAFHLGYPAYVCTFGKCSFLNFRFLRQGCRIIDVIPA